MADAFQQLCIPGSARLGSPGQEALGAPHSCSSYQAQGPRDLGRPVLAKGTWPFGMRVWECKVEGKWGWEWVRAGGCRAWVGGIERKLNGVLFTTSNPNLRCLPLRRGRDLVLKSFLVLSPEEMQAQNYFKAARVAQ